MLEPDGVPFSNRSVAALPVTLVAEPFACVPLTIGAVPFGCCGFFTSKVPLRIPSKSSGVGGSRDLHMSAIDNKFSMSERKT